jgi:hypothetical protein
MAGQGKTPFIKEHAFTIMKAETISQNLSQPRQFMKSPHIESRTAREQEAVAKNTDNDAINGKGGNPTMLPTHFLRGVTPIFLIRHPALVFDSILRVSGPTMGVQVEDEDFPVDASLRWLRVLYDWFAKSAVNGDIPIVLNADEIMIHPTIVEKVCGQLRLNPTGVRFEWDPVPPSIIEGQSSYRRQFFSTIQSSSGVRLDKCSAPQGQELDLDVMTAKWQEVYGSEAAASLRSFVDAAMPDYEYLCRCELRV